MHVDSITKKIAQKVGVIRRVRKMSKILHFSECIIKLLIVLSQSFLSQVKTLTGSKNYKTELREYYYNVICVQQLIP